MNQIELIKKLLPGLLPLIIFVIADSIWGTEIGLLVAIGFGLVEVGVSLFKRQKPDKFILFDVGLLVAMGGVSILLDNDLFFKLKPGVIGLMLCAVLGVSAYGKRNLMMAMSGRYMKGVEINPWQQYEFSKSIKILFWIFLIHTILVFISAIYMSKEAWVSISGPGFYVVFGLYFVFELYNKKQKQKKYSLEEWVPILNDEVKIVGKMPRSVAHSGSKILHPVVHLHVFNDKGDLYLQKRPEHKTIQPNKWDTAVGGHIADGESVELALQRESSEEIGLFEFEAKTFKNYVWESDIEKEYIFAFTTVTNKELRPDGHEVEDGRFWTLDEIEDNIGKGVFTPNFEHEFAFLKQSLT